jgi:hypothetical protein
MNRMARCQSAVALFAGLIACNPGLALADIDGSLTAYNAAQVGLTGSIRIGTYLDAKTNLNAVWGKVSYRVDCSDVHIRPALTGENSGSNNQLFGPVRVTLTAPQWYPTVLGLPGWLAVKAGSSFDCVHFYTGEARSNVLPIGGSGATFPLGGDSWSTSSSLVFDVIKPGTAGSGGCIP